MSVLMFSCLEKLDYSQKKNEFMIWSRLDSKPDLDF